MKISVCPIESPKPRKRGFFYLFVCDFRSGEKAGAGDICDEVIGGVGDGYPVESGFGVSGDFGGGGGKCSLAGFAKVMNSY